MTWRSAGQHRISDHDERLPAPAVLPRQSDRLPPALHRQRGRPEACDRSQVGQGTNLQEGSADPSGQSNTLLKVRVGFVDSQGPELGDAETDQRERAEFLAQSGLRHVQSNGLRQLRPPGPHDLGIPPRHLYGCRPAPAGPIMAVGAGILRSRHVGGTQPMRGHEPGQIVVPAVPRGGMVGRTAEVAAVRRALDRGRLVTVTGLPGVGKTAVARAVATAVSAGFGDGFWLVPLDAVPDGDSLPGAIAGALGVPGAPARAGGDPLAPLADRLRDRRLLLVLDTCEHLAGACSDLVTRLLLMPGRDVRILATSREPLRAPGGFTVAVRALPLRFAVTLFARRAAEVVPDFRITQENRPTVQEICLRLDRLPLAIELAARQVAAGSLKQLHARIRADYWFLRDPSGQATARHESLRAAIGWSHRLCTPAERALWARLSVFAGSFRLRDAQEVCADACLHEQAIGTAITMLVTRSVLLTEVQTSREIQFRLPATLRAYGAEMLREAADGRWARRYQAWQADRDSRHWCPGQDA